MNNQVQDIAAVENQTLELRLLLEAIYAKYGYDFRSYRQASVKRRVLHVLKKTGLESISKMQHEVIYDRTFFATLLNQLTVNVTEMFRDA
ncbi:MAG: protein-glutamate O-methyltransferase CheR, partial [bacterium]|nr:protein-glutamate O-methyltransferase CheR [bacterium]